MAFNKGWKPNKTQRAEFARKMADPDFKAAYEARKQAKADKRRAGSKFDYATAGGEYMPTKHQYNIALKAQMMLQLTEAQNNACNMLTLGYHNSYKIHHDFIHIVNELARNNPDLLK